MKRLKPKNQKLHLTLAAVLGAAALICFSGGDLLAADFWLPVEGNGCQVWSDEPLAKGEVIRWSGGCDTDKLSGKGVLEVLENDKRTLRFEGEMHAGKAEGPGKLENASKEGPERYEGGFAGSLFSGYGVYELADGSRYEGGFKNDKPDGYGLYKGANGDIYQGEIKAGAPQGQGFQVWPEGEMYQGAFVNGERSGTGTMLFSNGDVYEGSFRDDKANGKGKFTAANGEIYEGSWVEGKAEGRFIVTGPDGKREEQTWKNDQRVK
jgi:hypothetical protein